MIFLLPPGVKGLKEIKNFPINKAMQDSDIPTKLIKNKSDLFVDFIFTNLNDSIAQSTFPSLLKLTNVTPVHKKDSKTSKGHCRPVSILSNISKTSDRGLCSRKCLIIL